MRIKISRTVVQVSMTPKQFETLRHSVMANIAMDSPELRRLWAAWVKALCLVTKK